MKHYKHIIFDADHTLIDFDADERRAFRAAFPPQTDEKVIEEMWEYSYQNWAELGLNNVHEERIQQEYHALYHKHVNSLFNYAEARYSLPNRPAAQRIFEQTLSSEAHLIAGAKQTVEELAKRYCLSVATNGLTLIQTPRLSGLAPYFTHTFISEELGAIKPNAAFYQKVLKQLNAAPSECVMVGDSLTSDVAGANAAQIDAIWYNPFSRPLPPIYNIVAQVRSLCELKKLL